MGDEKTLSTKSVFTNQPNTFASSITTTCHNYHTIVPSLKYHMLYIPNKISLTFCLSVCYNIGIIICNWDYYSVNNKPTQLCLPRYNYIAY